MILKTIRRIAGKNISKFLYANALYTFSTGLISMLSPFILGRNVYEEFIYIFQNVMFLCNIFSLGLVPTLLRYYKIDSEKYSIYFYQTCFIIVSIVVVLGFLPANPISHLLKISPSSLSESVIIYLCVASQLIFIFNRGMMTAQESYKEMNIDVGIIFILRILALIVVSLNHSIVLKYALLIICIVPMSVDIIRFFVSVVKVKYCIREHKYYDFLFFTIKVSLIGIIYSITNRLFVVNVKGVDDSLAAVVSFSGGIVGIITIFNTTFTSYFIGKLDNRNIDGVVSYLSKIRKASSMFFICTIVLVAVVAFLVYIFYPYNSLQASIYSGITIFFSAMMFFVGLKTLLCKTYDLLNVQLLMNTICCLIIFVLLKLMSGLNYYLIFCSVHVVLLLTEMILAAIVERKISKIYRCS